ncbi:serine/threonine-protein kinase nek1 [Plakobranchus ocellatus]|uniref:non-specific serine/threonine protein kinase n=1 Tax=Plakobranchus ocellatus TaxID=259542 RepID=A0AAV4BBI6_9GAST|nr:serine/threonine-protein kinase nek1 [Plakobranchus ocellatus]
MKWFSQLLSALMYIHKCGILHRDIKPHNLFLDENHVLKLGDFGICRVLQKETDVAVTMIGTPFYLSPEICQHKPYSFKSDMWSAGCVLYEMCCLHVPFTAPNLPGLIAQILAGAYSPLPSHCSETLCEAVQMLLVADPDKRPSAEELLQGLFSQPKLKEKEALGKRAEDNMQGKEKLYHRKRKSYSKLDGDDSVETASKRASRYSSSDQKRIDSTTYTVVRHPKLRRLSPASSPELTLLLERQRSLSSKRQALEDRKVQSVDALPVSKRKHKNTQLNLRILIIENLLDKGRKGCSQASSPPPHVASRTLRVKWVMIIKALGSMSYQLRLRLNTALDKSLEDECSIVKDVPTIGQHKRRVMYHRQRGTLEEFGTKE